MNLLIMVLIVALALGAFLWWLQTQASFIDAAMKQVIRAALILAFLIWVFYILWNRFGR